MKKLFVLIIILCVAGMAYGQLKINPVLGITSTTYTTDENLAKTEGRIGYVFGAMVRFGNPCTLSQESYGSAPLPMLPPSPI